MKDEVRSVLPIAVAVVLLGLGTAAAQQPTTEQPQTTTTQQTTTQTATTTQQTATTQQTVAAGQASTEAAAQSTTPSSTQPGIGSGFWEPMAGFDIDSHATGYAWGGPQYQRRIRDNLAWTARASLNYLFYEFEEAGGVTKVRGPGVGARVGLKFGDRNWFMGTAGPSFRQRNRHFEINGVEMDRDDDDGWDAGMTFGGDAYLRPSNRVDVMAQAQYSTEDNFVWGRLMGKRQLSNLGWTNTFAHFAGAEVVGMGNDDFGTVQIGGLFEFLHVPSSMSIMLRAGFKRSMYDLGPDRTGPYFGIGYYQRIE